MKQELKNLYYAVFILIVVVFLVSAIRVSYFIISAGGLKAILVPSKITKLDEQPWKGLTIGYWLINENKKSIKREFVLDEKEARYLSSLFSIKEIRGMSVANQERFLVTLDDGAEWQMDMRQPNKVLYCSKENNYYAYLARLSNTDFYDGLRLLCLQHEQTLTPSATVDNIRLCNGGINNDIVETVLPLNSEKVDESSSIPEHEPNVVD